jgi:hypothetical protein
MPAVISFNLQEFDRRCNKTLNLEGSRGGCFYIATIFSTLVTFGITEQVFANVILDSMRTRLEFRPTAEIIQIERKKNNEV